MNGIRVMSCVQSVPAGGTGAACAVAQQKYIRISRGNAAGSAAFGAASRNNRDGQQERRQERVQDRKPERNRDGWQEKRDIPEARSGQDRGSAEAAKTGRPAGLVFRGLVLALVFAGMLTGFRMMTRASSRQKEPVYKYYTTVTIGYGEDLSDIVFRYCDSSEYRTADDYVREICEINSIPWQKGKVPDLRAGTSIVIPYYDTEIK